RVSVWRVETSWAARSRASSGWLHAWRAGAAISRSRAVSSWIAEPLTLGEVVADRPARIWTYTAGGPSSVWIGTDVAGYVAERAALGDVLELEAGTRLDVTRMSGMAWSRISPRVGIRWHIRETVDILGGYARYAHRLPLTHLAFGDPRAPSVDVRLWNDRNSDGVPQPAEAGTLVARLGPGNRDGNRSSLDPDLAVPWTDEVVAGLEWKPTARVRLGVTGLRRRDRRLIASVNSGLGPSDFDVRLLGDPGGDLLDPSDDQRLPVFERRPDSFGHDREILTNPPGLGSFFEALEIVLDRRADNWRLLFGATASRTVGSAANRGVGPLSNDQSTGGELFLAPNAATFKEGRLFFDRAFTVKLAGTVRAPLGIGLGFIARYQDGQPFARLVVVDDLAQGPDVVRAVPNGRHRFQYLATLDARLARTFTVLNGALTISLDAFNLLNDANEVEEDVVSGPRFRAVTAVQPPRTIRVGLAVSF
ncbi:MAG: TonB-dependent receptor, partial [Acidobacteria bacterium]|nr:TonB-dependent receptor [Acidobacteriota bacterium]